LRTRRHFRHQFRVYAADALEQIRDLLALHPQLFRVGHMLILAPAARRKVRARRLS
jgi:hypothetical protein